MAQHIGVIKIDESGETLKDLQLNFAEVNDALTQVPDYESKYPWLSSIDPYGDTIFNVLQAKHVISELNSLKVQDNIDINADILNNLITLFEELDTHEYIKFLGD
jgi:hypothetical protein